MEYLFDHYSNCEVHTWQYQNINPQNPVHGGVIPSIDALRYQILLPAATAVTEVCPIGFVQNAAFTEANKSSNQKIWRKKREGVK
jgi:hypothetical protein